MLPCLSISQTINLDNTKDVYKGLKDREICRNEDIPKIVYAVKSLGDILEDQTKKIEEYAIREKDLNSQITNLQLEAEKTAVDTEKLKAKKPKPFGIGIQIGYGINGADFKPYVGAGISYNFIRF